MTSRTLFRSPDSLLIKLRLCGGPGNEAIERAYTRTYTWADKPHSRDVPILLFTKRIYMRWARTLCGT